MAQQHVGWGVRSVAIHSNDTGAPNAPSDGLNATLRLVKDAPKLGLDAHTLDRESRRKAMRESLAYDLERILR